MPLAIVRSFVLFLVVIGLAACKDPNANNPKDFDRGAMLQHLGANVIVPAYQNLAQQTAAFDAGVQTFVQTPSAAHLEQAQLLFKNAYLAWQGCEMFELGPAETRLLRAKMNTFPASVEKIEANLNAGTFNPQAADQLPAIGFPALDYLLFGSDAVLDRYTTDARAEAYKNYLKNLSDWLKTQAAEVAAEWQNGYLTTFVAATGTDVGSSTGLLVNQFNYEVDLTKNARLGIPLGKKTLGIIQPDKVEALYSGLSTELLAKNIEVFNTIMTGGNVGAQPIGFNQYLDAIEAKHSGQPLSAAITAQFNALKTAVANIPAGKLSDLVAAEPEKPNAAHTEIQKLIVLTKTDMPSAMGILITYQDNDGD